MGAVSAILDAGKYCRCDLVLYLGWRCAQTDMGIIVALQVHDELLFEVKSCVLQ